MNFKILSLADLIKKSVFINTSCAVVNCLLILAVFAKISVNEEFMNMFFNSDTLYLPSIYIDIFKEGRDLSEWELNPAPNFFPDMMVYFILMAIFKNFILVSVIFSILQYVFVAWLFTKLFKLLFPTHSNLYSVLIHILFSFFLLESLFFTESFFYTFNILSNAYHTGSFILSICCFYLILINIKEPKKYHLPLLFLLISVSVVSDKLFVILFIAPLVATLILDAKSLTIRKTLLLLTVCLVALIFGIVIFELLYQSDYVNFCRTPLVKDFNNLLPSFNTFIELMAYYSRYFGFKLFILYLFILSFGLNAYLFFSTYKKTFNAFKFYITFILFFNVFVIVAPILSGNFLTGDQVRYNIFPFYLFPLNMAVFFASTIRNYNAKNIGKYGVLVGAFVLVFISLSNFNLKGVNSFLSYYPQTARKIDSLATSNNLRYGVAGYWDAKKTTMFSKKGVKLYHVYDDFVISNHVSNLKWYYAPYSFDFVLLNGIHDTTFVNTRLKPLNFICYQKDLKLLRVSPFKYTREQGVGAVNLNQ